MSLTIDAHQHFWQLSQPFNYTWLDVPTHAPIRRDYLPGHLQPLLGAVRVDRTVFVQTQHDLRENRWVLSLAEHHEFIAGVVGWIDLASPDCERQLLEFKSHPKFVGVRHITQDESDNDFIVREDMLRGLSVLQRHAMPFDLLFHVRHLRHVPTLARRLPDLPMVIDHLAKPHIREHRLDNWQPAFREAARFPNVYCKLSGMVTEADWRRWTAADLKPYVQTTLEAFGPKRCMFGSDWPVCELAASYGQVKEALLEALGPVSKAERERIFGGTAQVFYRLQSKP